MTQFGKYLKGLALILFGTIIFSSCQKKSENGCMQYDLYSGFKVQTSGECSFIPKPKISTNRAPIVDLFYLPRELKEGISGTQKVNAYDRDGDPLDYKWSGPNLVSIDNNGVLSWNPPQVDKDTFYKGTITVCDDKNACTSKDWEFTVKDEPPVEPENQAPSIDAVDVDAPATISGNTITANCGDDVYGTIVSSDPEGDPITNDISADSALNPWVSGTNFGAYANCSSGSGFDATNDLGEIVLSAQAEGGKDEKIFKFIGKNTYVPPANQAPKISLTKSFGDGTTGFVRYWADATDDSEVDGIEMCDYDGCYARIPEKTITWEKEIAPENPTSVTAYDGQGLSDTTSDNFSPASEMAWREMIKDKLKNKGFSLGQNLFEDYTIKFNASSNPECPYSEGTPIEEKVDIFGIDGNKWFSMNYTNPSTDNMIKDLKGYENLKGCRLPQNQDMVFQNTKVPYEFLDSSTTTFIDNDFKFIPE